MRKYLEVPIDLVEESADNPRQVFAADALEELKVSICQHGMLEPIVVRRNGEHFIVIAGARRLRAARLAAWETVPVLIDDKDPAQADLAAVAENLHREDLTPLEEARSYRRLLSNKTPAYTIDDLSAQFGKEKAYIYQRLTLLRLTPKIQKLLTEDVLPLSYALKLATVPSDRQSDALDICFRPLFRDEGYRRDQLEPLANLTDWLRDNVRRDPHGQDTQMLLPDLTAHVTATELERHRTILKVSELTFHTDRSDPDIILAKSWKRADTPAERCKHARPAIVVLGPNQDTVLDVCIAKKQCEKHWPALPPPASSMNADDLDDAPPQDAEIDASNTWKAREREVSRWAEEVRPRTLSTFVERTAGLTWSWPILQELMVQLYLADSQDVNAELTQLIGPIDTLSVKRYPQALAVVCAMVCESAEQLGAFAHKLGVSMEPTERAIAPASVESTTSNPAQRSGRKKKPAKAA